MNDIFRIETLDALKEYIHSVSGDKIREELLVLFNQKTDYQQIREWNELVRICEALAITGWGNQSAYEAIAEQWINGAFYTKLQNQFFEQKPDSNRQWSKHQETFVIADADSDKTDYGITRLASQRNRLPKSPIRWSRSGNYQTSVQALVDSLEDLKQLVVRQTRPELYGDTFSYVGINLNFSHHDDEEPSVRYEYFHHEDDVPNELRGTENPGGMPAYYIRPRLDSGKLATKNDELKLVVTRHFTRAFGELNLLEQQQILHTDFIAIVDSLADKLKKKKISYNTELLKEDLGEIFTRWSALLEQ